MKPNLLISIGFLCLVSCNNNEATKGTTANEPEKQKEVASSSAELPTSGDGLIGLWKLKLEAYDENENKVLDDGEKSKGIKNNYSFRFNSDGSCQIQGAFKGRYEEKTEKGNRILYVYRDRVVGEEDKDPVPDIYRIISVGKAELVLLEQEGNLTFWVFERAA